MWSCGFFFDSDALKPLAAACLLAPAAEQWTGALCHHAARAEV